MVASDVTAQAALLLNDVSQAFWTNTVLLPCLTKANEELGQILEANNINISKEVSSAITVNASAVVVTLPSDFVSPRELHERASGSSDKYIEVQKVDDIDINNTTSEVINEWAWREGVVKINPPSLARQVILKYIKKLTPLTAAGSVVDYDSSKTWLAIRTAQIAAKDLGHNPTKAAGFDGELETAKDLLVRNLVKPNQGLGARRIGYRRRR